MAAASSGSQPAGRSAAAAASGCPAGVEGDQDPELDLWHAELEAAAKPAASGSADVLDAEILRLGISLEEMEDMKAMKAEGAAYRHWPSAYGLFHRQSFPRRHQS